MVDSVLIFFKEVVFPEIKNAKKRYAKCNKYGNSIWITNPKTLGQKYE